MLLIVTIRDGGRGQAATRHTLPHSFDSAPQSQQANTLVVSVVIFSHKRLLPGELFLAHSLFNWCLPFSSACNLFINRLRYLWGWLLVEIGQLNFMWTHVSQWTLHKWFTATLGNLLLACYQWGETGHTLNGDANTPLPTSQSCCKASLIDLWKELWVETCKIILCRLNIMIHFNKLE